MARPSTAVYDGHAPSGSSIRSRSPLNPTVTTQSTTLAPHILSTSSHDAPSPSSPRSSNMEKANLHNPVKPRLNDHNTDTLTASGTHLASDVEAQNRPNKLGDSTSSPVAPAEYRVAARTKFLYLAGWFALNLTLTIYNKALLNGVSFWNPWLSRIKTFNKWTCSLPFPGC